MGFMVPVARPRITLMALWLPALPPAPTCERQCKEQGWVGRQCARAGQAGVGRKQAVLSTATTRGVELLARSATALR